ncbi:C-terminal domain phosphatase-like 4 [Actinidia rufa]|uniref:C-terminal domain phosphatase-like 4 n=1 Tax=Actinidia rufa TaxID=165716 RepID=A0A7J0FXV5_9ERIC|nr:C-terminal domain phosphatase-like 4 [Actinidia rufa]
MQMKLRDPFPAWMTFQMSLATDSPVHSSSSDDFAAFLDTELASNPGTSSDQEDEDEDEIERIKRQKVEVLESIKDPEGSTLHLAAEQSLGVAV